MHRPSWPARISRLLQDWFLDSASNAERIDALEDLLDDLAAAHEDSVLGADQLRSVERQFSLVEQALEPGSVEQQARYETARARLQVILDAFEDQRSVRGETELAALSAEAGIDQPETRFLKPLAFDPTDLICIPDGPFLLNEDPVQWHQLPTFHIARIPVTVAQFATFVQATDYQISAERAGDSWTWQHPRGRGSSIAVKADHPVTNVAGNDAIAYCEWLSSVTGHACRLPSMVEWEKAARGIDGSIYPWGNDPPNDQLCNFDNHVGDTTPVGCYPAGASPFGCLDMAGNVWEWTADCAGENMCYLKGGAWYSDNDQVKASAATYWYDLRHWSYDIGFRVVVAPLQTEVSTKT